MNLRAKRIGILVLGWAFILLGIAGLFLPVLQGILFLLVGLIILSSEYVWAHKLLTRLKVRFPKLTEQAGLAQQRAEHWLKRLLHRPAKGERPADADSRAHRAE